MTRRREPPASVARMLPPPVAPASNPPLTCMPPTASQSLTWPQTGVHQPDPFDAYDAAEAAAWDDLPYPRPLAERCEQCGYRVDAAGHLTQCGGDL